jgi:hypothetical protein
VISRTDAAAIVETNLNSAGVIRFVVTRVDERINSWVVYYDSEAHLNSLSVLDLLAGSRLLVVSKATGAVAVVTTPAPTETGIAAAEAKLGLSSTENYLP